MVNHVLKQESPTGVIIGQSWQQMNERMQNIDHQSM